MDGNDPLAAPKTWEQALDICFAKARHVMVNRHRKYGAGNILAFRELGVLVRSSDKVERLKRALLHGIRQRFDRLDDSEEDAWIDLANYGIIALMLRYGYWELPADCLGDDHAMQTEVSNDC